MERLVDNARQRERALSTYQKRGAGSLATAFTSLRQASDAEHWGTLEKA